MSEDNKQEAKPVPQQTEKQANPFGNLNQAEIPTRLHTFSYQGGEKEKAERYGANRIKDGKSSATESN